jgi:hypothetical protein
VISSAKEGARARRNRTRAAITTAAAIVAAAAFAVPASASLTTTGPIAPNGFPAWYQDTDGTQLELCLSGCPASPPGGTFTSPDGEAFYQLASGQVTDTAGHDVTVEMNVEGAFLGPTATDPVNDQITFGRIQVTMKGMKPNSDYTVTYPYGVHTWHTDANGNIAGNNRTQQRIETGCADTPCNFDQALGTPIGPFLKWDPAVDPQAPSGFIGDGVQPHAVVGSPFGTNFVRVNGPDLPPPVVDPILGVTDPGGISTDEFIVEGKLFSGPAPAFFAAQGAGAFGNQNVGTAVTKDITIKNNGLASMQLGLNSVAGATFAKTGDTCANANLASGATCTVSVRFLPPSPGQQTGTLTVDQGGTPRTIPLTGNGVRVTVTPPADSDANTGGNLTTTIIQVIQQQPNTQVKGTQASSLAVSHLTLARRISITRLRAQGLRASMQVQEGTNVVRIAIYKAKGGLKTGHALFTTTRTPRSAGLFRVTLRNRSMLSKLRPGSYVMQISSGSSASSLIARQVVFTVTR